ncbi:fused MFS/spermidine synthase [Candidatus Sumerlaeota bacterium]|nr:fused MFS/spermidine synthase [Candidatus Sumerlaeota bacterium]
MQTKVSTHPIILFICFFFSGIAGLIYEVVWSRYLALFIGSTGQAHVIILSVYVGGLALGAYIFGRKADRVENPLALYVSLEVGIGLMGLIYPKLFEPVRMLFLMSVRALGLHPASLHFSAILACAISLLLPTTLMGGTLPVLGRHMIRHQRMIGQRIASLYYLNSLGAVVGSLLAGFWLVRAAGLEMAMVTAGTLNLCVAFTAWLTLRSSAPGAEEEPSGLTDTSPMVVAAASYARHESRAWGAAETALLAIGLSGFASMVYEVAWIRLLALVLGSSSFSFALMLAAFIFGITLGSFILSFKREDEGYFRILGWSELAIGLTALLCILGYHRLPVILNQWRTSLVPEEYTYGIFQFVQFTLCFLVMVVPTIFMGMTLPAASRVVAADAEGLGKKIGDVFAINTVGTLIGAGAAGFLMMPAVGIRHTIETAVAINVVLGLWILLTDDSTARIKFFRAQTAVTLAAGVPILYFMIAPPWDPRLFSAATYRSRHRINSFAEFKEKLKDRKLLYYKDGTDASIAVSTDPDPVRGEIRALLINGKPDASNEDDMITQLMIGHLPMMLHPNPEKVLIVGLGSGVSAGATTLYGAKKIDCVELIPEVVEAARYFKDYNHNVCDHPVARIVLQDAKTFLQVTPDQYDVIVNQPTNLWISGVAGLFTNEYFEACRSKLRPGGFFVLWIQCYEILDSTMFSILNTYHQVFPYSSFFNLTNYDVVVIGSTQPFDPDLKRMEHWMAKPEIASDLAPFGVDGLLPILSMQMVAKNRTMGPYVDDNIASTNSDFFPTLEYEASRGFFIGSEAKGLKMVDRRGLAPGRAGLWMDQYQPAQAPPEALFVDYFNLLARRGSMFDGAKMAWCDLWARWYPDSPKMLLARGKIRSENEHWRLSVLGDDRLTTDPDAVKMRSGLLWEEYKRKRSFALLPDSAELRSTLEKLAASRPEQRPGAYVGMGDLDLDAHRPDAALVRYDAALKALDLLGGIQEDGPSREEILLRAADAYLDKSQPDVAREALKEIKADALSAATKVQYYLLRCRIVQTEQKR